MDARIKSGHDNMAVSNVRVTTLEGLPNKHFIDGYPVPSSSRRTKDTFDPGSARPFALVAAGGAEDIDSALEKVRPGSATWTLASMQLPIH